MNHLNQLLESSLQLLESTRAIMSPTDEEFLRYLSKRPDSEVLGLAQWGSLRGKKIARQEGLRRGIIKESFFKRLFSKFK